MFFRRGNPERGGHDGDGDGDDEGGGDQRHEFSHLPEHVQRRVAGTLRMHVLGSIRPQIEAGHLDFIATIRPLTCIFLGFPSLSEYKPGASVEDQVREGLGFGV